MERWSVPAIRFSGFEACFRTMSTAAEDMTSSVQPSDTLGIREV